MYKPPRWYGYDFTKYTFFTFTVPSDRPQNFVAEAISSKSINLMWDRPTTPNGVITEYNLTYRAPNSMVTSRSISGTMYIAEGLNEYTNYTFTIRASTSVGPGPQAEIIEITAEDGTYIYMCMCIYTDVLHLHNQHSSL